MSSSSVVCPVCAQTGCTNSFRLPDQHAVYSCRQCSAEFLYPQPSEKELAHLYSDRYFLGNESPSARARVAALKRATAVLYLEAIQPLIHVEKPKLLEAGCGSGDFLLQARSHGFEVEGLEYSAHAVETANQRLGKEAVQVGSLDTEDLRSHRYDAAVAFDVIEHVRQPAVALQRLHACLKTNGVLVLATPSLDSWSRQLLGKHWMEYKTEHLTYFGRRSLRHILQNLGFQEVQFFPNYKVLSLDYICEHFRRYPVPILSAVCIFLQRALPERWRHRPFKVVASGTLVTARKV